MVRTLKVLELAVHTPVDLSPETNVQSTRATTRAALSAQLEIQGLAKRTADMVFSTLAVNCPAFTVVVIKTTQVYPHTNPGTHAFLRSKQIDLYGRSSIVGMSVEPFMVKHCEPCSEILDADNFIID